MNLENFYELLRITAGQNCATELQEDTGRSPGCDTDLRSIVQLCTAGLGSSPPKVFGTTVSLGTARAALMTKVLKMMVNNARNYAASSHAEPDVKITWDRLSESGRNSLLLDWIERGGTPLNRGIADQYLDTSSEFAGEVTIYRVPGLWVRIELPLP